MKTNQPTNPSVPVEMLGRISEIFLRYGLRSTSMEDVCSHLRIAKKTLYSYFDNKDQLVEAVMQYRQRPIDSDKLRQDIKNVSSVRVLLGIIERFESMASRHAQMAANMYDLKKYYPATRDKVLAGVDHFIQSFLKTVVDKGIDEGLFVDNGKIDIQLWLVKRHFIYWLDPEHYDGVKYTLFEIFYTLMENFIRDIATAEGLKLLEKEKKNLEKRISTKQI